MLVVVLTHVGYFLGGLWALQSFFVLSGYLITNILLRTDKQTLSGYLKDFYSKRILRIFPVYFAFLGICVLIYLTVGGASRIKTEWPYLATYTENFYLLSPGYKINYMFSHFWSLAVEEQFYLIWPFLIFFASKKALKQVIVSLIVLAPLLRLTLSIISPERAPLIIYHLTFTQADAFAWGAALSVFNTDFVKRPARWLCAAAGIWFLLGVANFVWLNYHPPQPLPLNLGYPVIVEKLHTRLWTPYYLTSLGYPLYMINNYQHIWGYKVINAVAALLVLTCIRGEAAGSILENRFVLHLGKISYCTYIIHNPLIVLVHRLSPVKFQSVPGFLVFLIYYAVVILISTLSYNYFEAQFLKLKRRISVREAAALSAP